MIKRPSLFKYKFILCLMLLLLFSDSHAWTDNEKVIFHNFLSPAEIKWLEAHPVIRAAGPLTFPPFQFVDENGQTKGMAVDFLQLAAELLGIRIELHEKLPWKTVLEKIRKKEIDLLSCATHTLSREKYLGFTNHYLSFPMVIITRKQSPFVGSIEDLGARTVVFTKGVSTYEWLQQDHIKTHPYFVETFKEALEAVSTAKVDAYIGNLAAVTYYIEKLGMTNLKIAAPTPYGNYDLHMAVRKDWPELTVLLNKALNHITPEMRAQIRNRWLAVRYEYGIRLSDILIGVAAILLVSSLVIGSFVVWNRRLQQEIRERLRAETSLRESEERFKAVFNSAEDAIFIKNKALCYTLVNPAMERLYMIPAARFIGRKDDEIFDRNIFDNSEKTEQYVLKGNSIEEQESISTSSGEARTLHIIKVPLYSGEKRISGICGIIRDITRIKQMESQMHQAEKMDAVGALAGGMAHDFNNIMGIILGYTELALEDAPAQIELPRFLNQIRNATIRGRDLVRQLLHFGTHAEEEKQPLDLKPVIQNTLHMLRFSKPSDIALNDHIDKNLKEITGDSNKVHQMVLNLAQNAFHAMKDHGGTLSIFLENINSHPVSHFRAAPPLANGYIQLTVRDTGCGIAPEIRDRIFEPYFTSKAFGEVSGLGLAEVHGIVNQLKGFIAVESEVDKGTTVRILLPALPAKTVQTPVPSEDRLVKAGNILLIDDEIDLLDITEQILDRQGYQIKSLSDSRLAVEYLATHPKQFDLIIADVDMPQTGGRYFIHQMHEIRPDIPIIACSRQSGEASAFVSQLPGICRYMQKPLDRHELLMTVRKVLEGECS